MNGNVRYLTNLSITVGVFAYLIFVVADLPREPLLASVPLEFGKVRHSAQFTLKHSTRYAIELEVQSGASADLDRLSCLAGATPVGIKRCSEMPLDLRWAVRHDGKVVAQGENTATPAGGYTASLSYGGKSRPLAFVDGQKSNAYQIDVEAKDLGRLGDASARIVVIAKESRSGPPSVWQTIFGRTLHGMAAIGAGLLLTYWLSRLSGRARPVLAPTVLGTTSADQPASQDQTTPVSGGLPPKLFLGGAGLIGLMMIGLVNGFLTSAWWVLLSAPTFRSGAVSATMFAINIAPLLTAIVLALLGRWKWAYGIALVPIPVLVVIATVSTVLARF